MKRAILTSVLALSCATPAGVRESRGSAGLPGSFGGPGSATFALPATTIEPADSELSAVMFVTCGEGPSEAAVGVGLNGAPRADAPATIRIDGGDPTTLVLSFEPPGGTRHHFRLDMDGLADRIEQCESGDVDTSQAVRFVVHTAKPRLLNTDRLLRSIEEEYPRTLREAGVGGTTVLHILVSEEGRVQEQVVKESSGNAALDSAALRAIRVARFSPARNRDRNVAMWIEMPIAFRAR